MTHVVDLPKRRFMVRIPTWLRLTDGDGKEQCLMDCVQILLIDKAFSMSFRRVGFANKICFWWPYL